MYVDFFFQLKFATSLLALLAGGLDIFSLAKYKCCIKKVYHKKVYWKKLPEKVKKCTKKSIKVQKYLSSEETLS